MAFEGDKFVGLVGVQFKFLRGFAVFADLYGYTRDAGPDAVDAFGAAANLQARSQILS